jgi:ribosomal protein S18 acetylase RimI-like enzyme
MAQSVPATINRPGGPLNIVFGEGTPDQQVSWCEVAAAAFAPQVPASVFVEHGDALSQHPLARNKGIRYWCISPADNRTSVIAMCGTIRRPLLVRDSESMREEQGYCVFMVATHTQYRRLGLATMLMTQVAEWLDGPGDAAASMLYTSVGDVSLLIEPWCLAQRKC